MNPRVLHSMRNVALALSSALLTLPAHAQLFGGDNEAREAILKQRQELTDLRADNQRGLLQLSSQIEQLQNQMSQMRGQIETLTKQVADAQQRQRDLSLDMSERDQRQTNPPGTPDAGALLNASGDEQTAYDNAIDLFRQGSYKESASALGQFVERYPQSSYTPTAQFYWGSSLYALRDYKSAINRLQTMVKNWPDNQRAPDALLVIAGSQIELGDQKAARTTLERITKDYANSEAANTARDRLQLLR